MRDGNCIGGAPGFFFGYAAAVLALTATLKVIGFFATGPEQGRSDVVLDFVTNRELMILAAMLEYLLAAFLIRSRKLWMSACSLGYFLVCATIYQGALAALGNLPCNCLGATLRFVGLTENSTRVLTRSILGSLWAGLIIVVIIPYLKDRLARRRTV